MKNKLCKTVAQTFKLTVWKKKKKKMYLIRPETCFLCAKTSLECKYYLSKIEFL